MSEPTQTVLIDGLPPEIINEILAEIRELKKLVLALHHKMDNDVVTMTNAYMAHLEECGGSQAY